MSERWKPNVTVAAVIERDGRFLLVEEHTREGLRLNNPAGHLDPGESLQQGIEREVLEETACPFVPQALVGIYLARFHHRADQLDVTYLRFTFTGTVGEPEPGRALDKGIVRRVWLTADEVRASVEQHRSPLVLRCIEDHLDGLRYPLESLQNHPSLYADWVAG